MVETDARTPGLLSILMPVYNERAFLRPCLERVLAAPLPQGMQREIVMVEDASTDGTRELVKDLASQHADVIRAFFQEENQGKGAAIRRAVQEMRGQYAVIQDADLEYDPNEYAVLLGPLLDGQADVVYGSRFAASPRRQVLNYHHTLGNLFLTHLSNIFTGLHLTDMETCYKAFRADILKTIPLRSNRFGIEPEITAKVAKRGCSVYEVPISYHGRGYAEGKKIGWKDGVSAIYTLLKYWLVDDCYDEHYGRAVLRDLSQSRRYNWWTVSQISPFLGERILELGAGFGHLTRFLPKRELLTVAESDEENLALLAESHRDNDLVEIKSVDLAATDALESLGKERYDTVLCINQLEHIENDSEMLGAIRPLLVSGGRLVVLVPQYEGLYGSYDKALGHHRRYSRQGLEQALQTAGYRLVKSQSFNSLAILAWWWNSCLLRSEQVGKLQIKVFDMLVPLLRVVESILPLPGLSLVCVAERAD